MPSDNLSLYFLTPSRTFLCLYMRHTPPRRTRVCASLSLSLALLRGSLFQEPRLSLSRRFSPLSLASSLSPRGSTRLQTHCSLVVDHVKLTIIKDVIKSLLRLHIFIVSRNLSVFPDFKKFFNGCALQFLMPFSPSGNLQIFCSIS